MAGPQNFDLWIGETFQTHDPASPVVGVDIAATVPVTINWNVAGTELTAADVVLSAPQWQGVGHGPLTLYNPIGFALPPIGRVDWSVETHVIKKLETHPAGGRHRWAITPIVQLRRNIKMADGTPSSSGVVYTASDTARGGWF